MVVVVVLVPVPPAGLPVVSAALTNMVSADPDVVVVPPFVVTAVPDVATPLDRTLFSWLRRRLTPPVNHDEGGLRRTGREPER
jgi:hypothetical protein